MKYKHIKRYLDLLMLQMQMKFILKREINIHSLTIVIQAT